MPKVQVNKKKKHAKKDDVVYDFIHVVINLKTNYYLIDLDKGYILLIKYKLTPFVTSKSLMPPTELNTPVAS